MEYLNEYNYINSFVNYIQTIYDVNLTKYNFIQSKYDIWDNTIKNLIDEYKIDPNTSKKILEMIRKYNVIDKPKNIKQLFSCQHDFMVYTSELKNILKDMIPTI